MKIFSPGPVNSEELININFHHRSDKFKSVYREKCNVIQNYLNTKYKTLLVQGSGTSSIEAAINGLVRPHFVVLLLNNGTFSNRIAEILKNFDVYVINAATIEDAQDILKDTHIDIFISVLFETSVSKLNNIYDIVTYCNDKNILSIVDMVSALGYYEIPKASIICSSTSKILRGLPSLGLLLIDANILNLIQDNGFYLNLKRIISYSDNNETPHTSLIPQILSIKSENFFNKELINKNCLEIIPGKFELIGERFAPVLTLKYQSQESLKKVLSVLEQKEISIYYNSNYMSDVVQIGMFNGKATEYSELNTLLNI
jgi:aspartate aminotransferase-like enzyme